MLTFADERFSGVFVQITVHAVLLRETPFSLLQVVGDTVFRKKHSRFLLIIPFGCLEERQFQVLLVHIKRAFPDVGLVQTQRFTPGVSWDNLSRNSISMSAC